MTTVLTSRVAPVVAVALGVAAVGLGLVGLALGFAAHRSAGVVIASTAFVVPGAVVGALLAARRRVILSAGSCSGSGFSWPCRPAI